MSTTTSNQLAGRIGVNVAGYLRGGLGLGQAARLYVQALVATGVPVRTTTVDVSLPEVGGARAKTVDFTDLAAEGDLPFNLVCVNAPELPAFRAEVGQRFFQDRYTIGVWGWEVDVVPASWDPAFRLVDEIWVYSAYTAEILGRAAPCPVVRIPLPIVAPPDAPRPSSLDLPDGFYFLFLFDFFSTLQRKNPLGLVEAFTRAFAPGEGPHLVLKSFNGDYKPEALARLLEATAGRPDIHVVDRFLSAEEMAGLMRGCGAYVSLHRAEGFGLTLGEAMALGKPVIATGYSANLDFMTPENSYLVRHGMTEVGPEGENYPATGTWADPDLDHAAELMRAVYTDRAEATDRGRRAQADIAEGFSVEAVGALARARLRRVAGLGRHRSPSAGPGREHRSLPVQSWLDTAETKLTYDPLRDAVESGGPKGLARRAALQAMRPYTHHQDELNAFAVRAVREVADRVEDLTLETQAHLNRLQDTVRRLGADMASGDLHLLLEGVRARPGSTHPAISYRDASGRLALGFRDAVSEREGGYRGFEDIFRGDENLIRARQAPYLELLAGREWVLDLGCGRGEFLDDLRERGIGARGVDLDESMVLRAREKGHDVQHADAAGALRGMDDDTVPAVFLAQVVEHLSSDALTELLELMHAKLARGGLAIMETVNPHNPIALKAFWTDPTHHHPLFPEVLLALSRLAGFDSGDVIFQDATDDFDRDVYANHDYAVVVTKARR